MAQSRVCSSCGKRKSATISNFRMCRGILTRQCLICISNQRTERWRNDEDARQRYRQYRINWRNRLRDEVYAHYGSRCQCCGESNTLFLTIDHVNGGGKQHRKVIGNNIHMWLRKNNYPKGFRTLCWNCNCGISRNGGVCPHKQTMREIKNG